MIRFHHERVCCPHCANEQEVVIWDVVDAGEDPDLRERLLSKQLQSFRCHNCDEDVVMAESFLYLDRVQGLVCYYCPQHREFLESHTELPKELTWPDIPPDFLPVTSASAAAEVQGGETGFSVANKGLPVEFRLAPSYNTAIEKVHLRAAGLDDRLMELIKLALKTRYLSEEQMRFEELYFLEAHPRLLLFQALETMRGWQMLEIKRELYNNAEQALGARLPVEKGWACIGEAWARSFVGN